MKKNKANVICSVICILITVALVGVAVCGIVKHNKEKSREQAMNERLRKFCRRSNTIV